MLRRKKWISRLRRLALVSLCLVVGGLLLVNVAINVPPLKGKLQRMAAGQLGQPVRIGWGSYWPWSGGRLNNVRVGQEGAPVLVTDVRVRVAPLKFVRQWLAGGDVEIGEVECLRPKFSLSLPEPQAIRVASNVPVQAPASVPAPTVEPVPAPAPAPAPSGTGVAAPAPTPPASSAASAIQRGFLLAKVKMSGGEIVIEDRAGGRPVATVEALEFELLPPGEAGVYLAGTVRLGAVSFLGRRVAGSGSAQVSWKPMGIEIRDVELPFDGGVVRGNAKVETTRPGNPFTAEFSAGDIDLSALVGDLGDDVPVELLSGEGRAKVRIQGLAAAPGDTRARIAISASEVRVKIADGEMAVTDVEAMIDLVRGNLLLSEAGARTGGLWIKSSGRLGRDGGLDLIARLYAAGDLRGAIGRGAANAGGEVSFRRLPETEWYYHDFRVGGSIAQPLADFWNRGEAMPITSLLRKFFQDAGLADVTGGTGE